MVGWEWGECTICTSNISRFDSRLTKTCDNAGRPWILRFEPSNSWYLKIYRNIIFGLIVWKHGKTVSHSLPLAGDVDLGIWRLEGVWMGWGGEGRGGAV
jgi:hypothetical protein